MPISGRSFQFSIGSTLSFQFRAGFASTYYARPQADDQLKSHHAQEVTRAKSHSVEAISNEDSDFYEVVGPYSDDSITYTHKGAPATIALPASTNNKPVSAEILSRDGHFAGSYGNESRNYQGFIGREKAYMHSYNHNGRGVYPVMEASTIDLVI